MLDRERIKLDRYLAGVKDMGRLPGAVFIVDGKREGIAVKEAAKLGIPIIAITDTNADPDTVDFPIPGNDDAIRSVSLIAKAIADTIEVARGEVPEDDRRRIDELEATTYSTETGETTEKEAPKRRRPRRKRRPRPEVIAQHLKEETPEGEAAEDAPAEEAEAPAAEAAPAEAEAPAAGRGRRPGSRGEVRGGVILRAGPGSPAGFPREAEEAAAVGHPRPLPPLSTASTINAQRVNEE